MTSPRSPRPTPTRRCGAGSRHWACASGSASGWCARAGSPGRCTSASAPPISSSVAARPGRSKSRADRGAAMKRIALVGMPNTGKSTFFNRITGASARVGNWPGITVDLLAAKLPLGGAMVELVDLPGVYDLHGFSDDERIVRRFLESTAIDLVVVLLNAAQVDRQLALAVQVRRLGLPAVLLLNMADEAKKLGIRIDEPTMARELGMPVAQLSAKYGRGQPEAMATIARALATSQPAA